MNRSPSPTEPQAPQGPGATIALDGLAYGIDYLDAILVLHLGDAHLHAAWVRPGSALHAADLASTLRDAYRACQLAARRITAHGAPGVAERRGEVGTPLLTLEIPTPPPRTATLRRVRSHVVACLFDAAMPLGMARFVAARLTAVIEPELPRTDDRLDESSLMMPLPASPSSEAARVSPAPAPLPARIRLPEDHTEREPSTLSFGASRSHRFPPQSRATATEIERTRRILTYYEAHAPEPHVARHRLALRAGLTLIALDHPEALLPEAMVLIETAVEDILGLDRAEIRRLA